MAPRSLAGAALLTEDQWGWAASVLRLSGRELQIVRDVFDNHTEHAIAASHGITDGTVHTHLKRLYHKLAVTTRAALVLRVMETVLHRRNRSVQPEALAPLKRRRALRPLPGVS